MRDVYLAEEGNLDERRRHISQFEGIDAFSKLARTLCGEDPDQPGTIRSA